MGSSYLYVQVAPKLVCLLKYQVYVIRHREHDAKTFVGLLIRTAASGVTGRGSACAYERVCVRAPLGRRDAIEKVTEMRRSSSAACLRAGVLEIQSRKSSAESDGRKGRSGSRLGLHASGTSAQQSKSRIDAGEVDIWWKRSVRGLLLFAVSVLIAVLVMFIDINISSSIASFRRPSVASRQNSSWTRVDGDGPSTPHICLHGGGVSDGIDSSSSHASPPLRLQEPFDALRFAGDWYEIVHFDVVRDDASEKGDTRGISSMRLSQRAPLDPRRAPIRVSIEWDRKAWRQGGRITFTSARSGDGDSTDLNNAEVQGIVTVPDSSRPAALLVDHGTGSLPYFVVASDYENYAVVYTCTTAAGYAVFDTVRFLSRYRELPPLVRGQCMRLWDKATSRGTVS